MSDPLPVHFYDPHDDGFAPTRLATGPWDRRLQSGVALAGLVAHLVERHPTPAPMSVARLVIDIMRPTPMAPVVSRVTELRSGKRLQLLEIELSHEGETTLKASALRVRLGDCPATEQSPYAEPPASLPVFSSRSVYGHIVESRLERGGLEQLGPGVTWMRMFGEIVPGVPISPFVQLAMAADCGSGLSAYVDWRQWTFANVDISLHLARMPQGPWVRIAARTESAGNGIGVVDATLSDLGGDVGHAHQTLFLDRSKR
ncbi:MAG: thioesterase family protein [Novosphingobium sp.]|nr:thioesterase family protein [Novosphingobium sp.]